MRECQEGRFVKNLTKVGFSSPQQYELHAKMALALSFGYFMLLSFGSKFYNVNGWLLIGLLCIGLVQLAIDAWLYFFRIWFWNEA
jgi:hypothetical protein